MVNISTANPFTKPCPRPQANFDWPVSLPLSGQKAGQARKRAGPFGSCPAYGSRVGAQVALQRCLTLRTSGASLSCFFTVPFKRGHLYFAKKGTFLLGVDSKISNSAYENGAVKTYAIMRKSVNDSTFAPEETEY